MKNISSLGREGRELGYDWLRLIATMLVVLGHSTYFMVASPNGGINYSLPPDVSPVFHTSLLLSVIRLLSGFTYSFHMPLFFMLSGAVLALRPIKSPGSFIRGKVSRLIVPYVLFGCFYSLPVKYIAGFYTAEGVARAYLALPFGTDCGHLWFLPALFWCMLVFAFLSAAADRLGVKSNYALPLFCAALQLGARYIPFDMFLIKMGMEYIFWFALGWLYEKEWRGHMPKRSLALLPLAAAAFVLSALTTAANLLDGYAAAIFGSIGACFLARASSASFARFTKTGLWALLMRNCFNIYLFHDPLEFLTLRVFMENGWLRSAAGCYLFYFCRIVVVTLLSILMGEMLFCAKSKLSKLR